MRLMGSQMRSLTAIHTESKLTRALSQGLEYRARSEVSAGHLPGYRLNSPSIRSITASTMGCGRPSDS
jgi:hypothetical protein